MRIKDMYPNEHADMYRLGPSWLHISKSSTCRWHIKFGMVIPMFFAYEDELSQAQIVGIAQLVAGQLAYHNSARNSRRHPFQALGPGRDRKNYWSWRQFCSHFAGLIVFAVDTSNDISNMSDPRWPWSLGSAVGSSPFFLSWIPQLCRDSRDQGVIVSSTLTQECKAVLRWLSYWAAGGHCNNQ